MELSTSKLKKLIIFQEILAKSEKQKMTSDLVCIVNVCKPIFLFTGVEKYENITVLIN